MKIDAKNKNGETQHLEVSSLIITFSNGETIEITDESKVRPASIPEGVIVWGGRMPEEGATLDKLKEMTRCLGLYPLASNMVHIFPYSPTRK
ncbi:hypothetical protein ID517_002756 [Escherichia coli]|nr:hypothetical protein [Escherichia coli]EGH1317926.1 hypothetical protein [Escherichia coli]EGH1341887.1 hypothetical protein [Escherichia coli]WFX18902.1 hypothetical protein NFJ96_21640 [Escherichia coli]HEI3199141.1 hypothetical protein [Escherichia coli]